jgi:hypothetical protein
MKKITNVFLIFFSVALGFSQTTIALKENLLEIKNQNFYIDKVIDDRQELHLGVVADNSGKKVKMSFQKEPVQIIKKFLDAALAVAIDKVPITLRIQHLKIEAAQTSIDKRTARAYIALNFMQKTEKYFIKLLIMKIRFFQFLV